MKPTDKEIQELNCEIAELVGWRGVNIHPNSGAARGLKIWGRTHLVEDIIPNYTGDMNVLLGEVRDWLGAYGVRIEADVSVDDGCSVVIIASGIIFLAMGNAEALQEAAYHAVKEALPRIKEIIKEKE
jgi:hypothetical protein